MGLLNEALQQDSTQTPTLPLIAQHDGELRVVIAANMNESRHADLPLPSARLHDRYERELALDVDVHPSPQFRQRRCSWRQQSLIAGPG